MEVVGTQALWGLRGSVSADCERRTSFLFRLGISALSSGPEMSSDARYAARAGVWWWWWWLVRRLVGASGVSDPAVASDGQSFPFGPHLGVITAQLLFRSALVGFSVSPPTLDTSYAVGSV